MALSAPTGEWTDEQKSLRKSLNQHFDALNAGHLEDDAVRGGERPVDAKPDDAFAERLGVENLEKLRELIKTNLEQQYAGASRFKLKRALLDQLDEQHDFPLPPKMVEAEFAQIWQQLEHEATHEPDPDAARAEMEAERNEYHAIAERRVVLEGRRVRVLGAVPGTEPLRTL